jgi:hypothetical protein
LQNKLQNDAIEFVGDVIDECVGQLCVYPLAITLLKWLENDMLNVDATLHSIIIQLLSVNLAL